MKLLFATNNPKKVEYMKNRLKALPIEVITPIDLGISIDVVEDGTIPCENALKKAREYYEVAKIATIAEDSALYIDKFEDKDQPGLFVRRINGREDATNEEVIDYYIEKLTKLGGDSLANYLNGVAIIDSYGNESSVDIEEDKFLMTNKRNENGSHNGAMLDVISIDNITGKYFNELTFEDRINRAKKFETSSLEFIKEKLL